MENTPSPRKTWTVVKFKEDCSVSAVPTEWIIENGECLWPPFTADKITAAIKNHVTSTCWPKFKIDVFRNATYDNYDTARSKSIRAEDTSDLNTEDEYPKRKRGPKKMYSSSEESIDESLKDILRTPPKICRKKEPAKNPICAIPAISKKPSLGETSCSTVRNDAKNMIHVVSGVPEKPLVSSNHNIDPIVKKGTSSIMARNNDKENCTCCQHHKHTEEYLKQILSQQNFIKSVLSDLLLEIRATKIHNEPLGKNDSIFKKFKLPIEDEQEFEIFNNHLKDEENFRKAVAEMCKIGGKDNYEFVKRCMGLLISNDLAVQYSWLGRRTKKSFCNFEMSKLIINAADMAQKSNNYQDTENSLKNWLRRARDRKHK